MICSYFIKSINVKLGSCYMRLLLIYGLKCNELFFSVLVLRYINLLVEILIDIYGRVVFISKYIFGFLKMLWNCVKW